MRSRHRRSRANDDEGINLTPLLDMIFNLLFFFILATTIGHSRQIAVNLPKTESDKNAASEKQVLIVSVTSDNRYFLDAVEMPLEELVRKSKEAIDSGQAVGVSLRGDSQADWQAMFTLFEAFSRNNLSKFLLDGQRMSGQ